MAVDFISLLSSHVKLDRDRGATALEAKLNEIYSTKNKNEVLSLQETFLGLARDKHDQWEVRFAGLLGTKLVVSQCFELSTAEYKETARVLALQLMHDDEARVRIAAGEVLGALCQCVGPDIYSKSQSVLLESVSSNLERQLPADTLQDLEGVMLKLSSDLPRIPSVERKADASQIFHDTAGWKHLETSMRCLQSVIEGCGHCFNDHVTQGLLDLIFQALTHTNRFVRETGYQVCASLVRLGRDQDSKNVCESEADNSILVHGEQFSQHLANGLADNWSQVRLAASMATRQFLQTLPNEDSRKIFYPLLLPPMCLNRYYVAEGVRIYSQETWRMIIQEHGKELVECYIKEIVSFYTIQTEADNHAVREAACSCIAELGSKLSPDVVRPYIQDLLPSLICCFKDDSWPVRDAACVACGNFVKCFPEECRSSMTDLYPLFYENLADNIPSVRQGAALALANVVRAYGDEALTIVVAKINECLPAVEKQMSHSERYGGLDTGPAVFGVVKKMRDNDMDLHTNKPMYSCGSLAPKMGRGKGGGCSDCRFRRPPEPWEMTDGCVYAVAELSSVPSALNQVQELVPMVAKASRHKHYTQHPYLMETIAKQIPVIAKGIGKRNFKKFIESFLDMLFYSLKCENQLTSAASSECLLQLSQLLGPSILRGRVEQYNPNYLPLLDQQIK